MIVRLDRDWQIARDPENKGRASRWFEQVAETAQPAPVPGIIQQVFPAYHGVAWYWHSFRFEQVPCPGERVLLHFGAVDYLAEVWVNGKAAGTFEGGETRFSFDVAELLRTDGDNLLAMRVLNPTDESIDGYVLDQVPHRNKVINYSAGCSFNSGGIMYPVELHTVPALRITDIFPRPDPCTGKLAITVTVRNDTDNSIAGHLRTSVAEASGAEDVLCTSAADASFAPGESSHQSSITIAQPRPWNMDDPFLYRVGLALEIADQAPHRRSVRCGFRNFRIVDGYFHLNGKRLFLKCSHTGNHVPIGQQLAVIPDHVRRDMINAKACGFNAVRFISGVAWPEQLDFCDEIGLMVIESSYAGWQFARSHVALHQLPNSPELDQRYDHSVSQMILRDRNHPSIVAWELLNETHNGPIFERACAFLPKALSLDATRLVMLNSGRFDNCFDIGSCCNPGGDSWEHVWGIEAPDGPRLGPELKHPSLDGAGDFHFYPSVPHTPETLSYLRNIGRDSKPVFLSEYGIGSLYDVIGEWRHFEQSGARPDLEDAALVREQSEKLCADWRRLGFDGVYPFPEDMLRDSQRLSARQRTLGFNLVRANPKLCGFNLTGLLDHGMTGEGLWKFWRDWKPEMFDAVCDGWSPLRWCLFVDPIHAYTGRDLTVEAVLATEDALEPGLYPARFKVSGPDGTVREWSATVTIPDPSPLAVPVLREIFRLEGPAAQYTFSANLERGGAATGGSLTFPVSDPGAWPELSGNAAVWGLDGRATEWLRAHGLTCQSFQPEQRSIDELILVGLPDDVGDAARWELLRQRMQDHGATVLFLDGKLFKDHGSAMEWLPLSEKGKCIAIREWLYHKECVANRHPVFEGMQGPGVMDMDYYGPVIPEEVFVDQSTPDETICAGFNTGYFAVAGGYRSSLLIAAYGSGKGRFILNTPRLLENLDKHPAADRLLFNLIRYAGREDT